MKRARELGIVSIRRVKEPVLARYEGTRAVT
jgi:hypothetical protein